jgi:chromosome partitioning protein
MRRKITVAQREDGTRKRRLGFVSQPNSPAAGMMSCWSAAMLRFATGGARQSEIPVYEMTLGQISLSERAQDVRGFQAGLALTDTAPNAREMGASISLANLIQVSCLHPALTSRQHCRRLRSSTRHVNFGEARSRLFLGCQAARLPPA